MKPTIHIKRIYDAPAPGDGRRILVDRLWPRGITKADAGIAYWAKEIAPSNELRKWYNHDPDKWDEFRQRYFAELDANPTGMQALSQHLDAPILTFLYGSKEPHLNNAVALQEYLQARPKRG